MNTLQSIDPLKDSRWDGFVAGHPFGWVCHLSGWKKVLEELAELRKAEREASSEAIEGELGDLLFTLVNWARFKGISTEEALRKANRRFAERFFQVEQGLRRRGRRLEDSTMEEMDELWNQAKRKAKRRERSVQSK